MFDARSGAGADRGIDVSVSDEQLFSRKQWAWVLTLVILGLLFWFLPPIAAEQDAVYRSFTPLVSIKAHIHNQYVEPVDDAVLAEGAIRGMLRQLDPHSVYMSPREYDLFLEHMRGDYVGIGVQFDLRKEHLVVVTPLENSPAHKAGLRSGDVIVEISGIPVDPAKGHQESERLRGLEGSTANFKVQRPPQGEIISFAVRRERVRVRNVYGFRRNPDAAWDFMLEPQHGIGYIRIADFWDNTLQDFDAAVAQLRGSGVRGLVLDVRFNPGGDMAVACGVANRFISNGVILTTRNRRQVEDVIEARPMDTLPDWPVVVLTNALSASGAEILAGALQEHHRATVVGERTFGKGSVQTLVPLDDQRSALRLTTAYYYLPSGRLIHRRPGADETENWGIAPDRTVKISEQEMQDILESWGRSTVIENGQEQQAIIFDRQLQEALAVIKGEK